jgi:hypothetical protein
MRGIAYRRIAWQCCQRGASIISEQVEVSPDLSSQHAGSKRGARTLVRDRLYCEFIHFNNVYPVIKGSTPAMEERNLAESLLKRRESIRTNWLRLRLVHILIDTIEHCLCGVVSTRHSNDAMFVISVGSRDNVQGAAHFGITFWHISLLLLYPSLCPLSCLIQTNMTSV